MDTRERHRLKLSLFSRLDPATFTWLIADILAVAYKHTEVKVLDGPGDGKRDIASTNKWGQPYITQCKFHKNPKTSVGSRDTDELPIALLKFGCRAGAFFTSGRASAQAKREYLDNYPEHELLLSDGDDLIETITNTPALRLYWLSSGRAVDCTTIIEIPVIIRNLSSDTPILPPISDAIHQATASIEFAAGRVYQSRFHPYRPPISNTGRELSNGQVFCTIARFIGGAIHSALTTSLFHFLSQHIAQGVERPVAVRFGSMELVSLKDQNGGVTLDNDAATFVISRDGKVYSEHAWAVFFGNSQWRYPKTGNSIATSCCGWHNKKDNVIINQFIDVPMRYGLRSPQQGERDMLERYVLASYFLRGTLQKIELYLNNIPNSLKPDWSCPIGESERLLGWMSPAFLYSTDENGRQVFMTDATGYMEVPLERLPSPEHFAARCAAVAKRSREFGLTPVDPEAALTLSRLENYPLVADPQLYSFDNTELVREFECHPSPVYAKGRICLINAAWKIPLSYKDKISSLIPKLVASLPEHTLEIDEPEANGRNCFLRISITMLMDTKLSADENISQFELLYNEWIPRVGAQLAKVSSSIKLATREYWSTIGFSY